MPYPSEHSYRIRAPDGRRYVRYRSLIIGRGIRIVLGVRRGRGPLGGRTEAQAIRFRRDLWSPAAARRWLRDHDFPLRGFEEAA